MHRSECGCQKTDIFLKTAVDSEMAQPYNPPALRETGSQDNDNKALTD
ncbi:hypothetical protein GCM10007879_06820 [Maritalea porphyrae]|uniref:Uncharacterized protein n=1 Tax=Maritalea porphyrae TaxID=880732 RepID=A0ABQ5UPA5_9HYPH|nr:hypothetical protein GCM10007879_06820 [Maritalea porphyrae]